MMSLPSAGLWLTCVVIYDASTVVGMLVMGQFLIPMAQRFSWCHIFPSTFVREFAAILSVRSCMYFSGRDAVA